MSFAPLHITSTNNRSKTYSRLVLGLVFVALTLTGCNGIDDPEPAPAPDPTPVIEDVSEEIRFKFAKGNTDLEWTAEAVARDEDKSIPAAIPADFGVYGYNNLTAISGQSYSGKGEVFANRQVYYCNGKKYADFLVANPNFYWNTSENEWPYENPELWQPSTFEHNTRYRFFVYSPYDADNVRLEEGSYDGIRTFIWSHIPRYSGKNLLFSENIISYKAKKSSEGLNAVQVIKMKHLQSRIRFCFRLGPKYSDVRKLRLRSMKVKNLLGNQLELKIFFNQTGETDANGNKLYSLTTQWTKEETSTPGDAELDLEPGITDYLELSAENRATFQPFASLYAYPYDDLGGVDIEVTYDVVDLKGQLLRGNEHAVNNITLNLSKDGTEPGPGKHVMHPGYYYDVNIQIEPSFLYVLSDNDYDDAPGYLIINDD